MMLPAAKTYRTTLSPEATWNRKKPLKNSKSAACIAGPQLCGTSSAPQAAAKKLLSITFVRKMPASGKHAWGNHTLSVS